MIFIYRGQINTKLKKKQKNKKTKKQNNKKKTQTHKFDKMHACMIEKSETTESSKMGIR